MEYCIGEASRNLYGMLSRPNEHILEQANIAPISRLDPRGRFEAPNLEAEFEIERPHIGGHPEPGQPRKAATVSQAVPDAKSTDYI